jgi:hypothetical protein
MSTVPPLKAQSGRYAVEQIGFAGAVQPDQQQGFTADQRAKDCWLDGVQPDDTKLGEQGFGVFTGGMREFRFESFRSACVHDACSLV